MFRQRPYLAIAALLVSLFAARTVAADFELGSLDLYTIQYESDTGKTTTLTIQDAKSFQLIPIPGGIVGYWTLSFLGKDVALYIALMPVDGTAARWRIAVLHPAGLPLGWRLTRLEQRFGLRQTYAGAARADRCHIAKVYESTAYPAGRDQNVTARYPNFLQTQQVTLVNDADRRAASLVAEDVNAHRKFMGFRCTANGELREIYVAHIPENLGQDPFFVPAYSVVLKTGIQNGLNGALRWYRAVQKRQAQSFLSRRTAGGPHAFLKHNKFIVFAGAAKTQKSVGKRYDLTDAYVRDVLDTFGALHGKGLMMYYMGWQNDTGTRQNLWPEMFDTILPGYRKLVAAAKARGYRNIPYFWPSVFSPHSRHYDATTLRVDRKDRVATVEEKTTKTNLGVMSWYSKLAERVYTPLIADTMMQGFGFDGAYLDALEASSFCYRKNNPTGENEQHIGIERWLGGLRRYLDARKRAHFFTNETPTEVFSTDMSGLDITKPGHDGLNLFRRTYTGREWPTTHLVLAAHSLHYQLSLLRGLVEGARPTVIWPEFDGMIPSQANKSATFKRFLSLLQTYSQNYDQGFHVAIDGLLKAQLPTFETTMIPEVKALQYDEYAWFRPTPAVLHGVFAPDADSNQRTVLLARWTSHDAAQIDGLNLPASHPLKNVTETVKLGLSKTALDLDATKTYEIKLYDPNTKTTRSLGRLPADADTEIKLSVTLAAASFQLLQVTPVV
jgi:hypothetical protein